MVVTSVENERIKNLCKLEKKKFRDLTNTYLVEGEHLVIEALKAGETTITCKSLVCKVSKWKCYTYVRYMVSLRTFKLRC